MFTSGCADRDRHARRACGASNAYSRLANSLTSAMKYLNRLLRQKARDPRRCAPPDPLSVDRSTAPAMQLRCSVSHVEMRRCIPIRRRSSSLHPAATYSRGRIAPLRGREPPSRDHAKSAPLPSTRATRLLRLDAAAPRTLRSQRSMNWRHANTGGWSLVHRPSLPCYLDATVVWPCCSVPRPDLWLR